MDKQEIVTDAASGVVGTVIGLATGPAAPITAPIAAAAIRPFVAKAVGEFSRESQEHGDQVFVEGCMYARMDPEEFVREVSRDEHRRLLGGLAFYAGARTRNAAKIRALGRAIANGGLGKDDALLDESLLIVRAFDDLEGPHIAVLELLVTKVPGNPPRPYTSSDRSGPGAPARRWTLGQLGSAKPESRAGMSALLGPLQQHGLVREELNIIRTLENYEEAQRSEERQNRDSAPRPQEFRRGQRALPSGMRRAEPEWITTSLGERVYQYLLDVPNEAAEHSAP